MNKVMCSNHHYYDADQNSVCPHCGSAERINEKVMEEDSIGATTWLGSDGKFHNTNTQIIESTTYIDDIDRTVIIDSHKYANLATASEKRCHNCFQLYKDIDGLCPHCGHSANEMGKEPYYLKPGTIIAKRYIIGQALGAGGFGITYKAWDNTLQSIVAIKEFFPVSMVTRIPGEKKVVSFSAKKENDYAKGLKEFLLEARMMSRFSKNENICNTYSFFEENNTAYIVMEFLHGNSLKDYLKDSGYWPNEEESISIILQVLEGLDAIHKQHIVHLDIAPDNIWILPNGKVKIIDFGAARHTTEKQCTRALVVKRGFAPYEQYLEKGNVGPWTDIYAAGATLYYLLTKRVPIESSDRYSGDNLEEPSSISLASQNVSNTVMRAMAVETELRYHNVKEFIDDLKRDKVRSLEKEAKRRKRKKTFFALSVILACLILVAGCFYAVMLKNRMVSESLTVWIMSEETAEETAKKQERYEESIALFRQTYPQISIELVVKDAESIEDEFLNISNEDKPDLIETTAEMTRMHAMCSSLEEQLLQESDILNGIVPAVQRVGSKYCPLGMDISVVYKEKGKMISDLSEVSIEEFLTSGKGYCKALSEEYFVIRDTMAGLYSVEEASDSQMILDEMFSVYPRNASKESTAFALLSYLLTDAAQDILHIQNRSTSLPVSKEALATYLQVYAELEYLNDSLNSYKIILDVNE